MRKYDIKNKRNIGIIIGISIIIIIMFSLVIKLFLSSDKKEYTVHDGALVFDKDKSIIKVTEDSTIKKNGIMSIILSLKIIIMNLVILLLVIMKRLEKLFYMENIMKLVLVI